jgi:hypothetical protein
VVKDNVEVAETLLQCGADPNLSVLGEANLLCIAQKLQRHRFVLTDSLEMPSLLTPVDDLQNSGLAIEVHQTPESMR